MLYEAEPRFGVKYFCVVHSLKMTKITEILWSCGTFLTQVVNLRELLFHKSYLYNRLSASIR